MPLREKRVLFTRLICRLRDAAEMMGYEAAFAEGMDRKTLRDPTSDHRVHSLHDIGLAQDIDLYNNGTYLTQTSDHRRLGEWWETQHPLCRWGGRFGDGNHYSMEHEGRK